MFNGRLGSFLYLLNTLDIVWLLRDIHTNSDLDVAPAVMPLPPPSLPFKRAPAGGEIVAGIMAADKTIEILHRWQLGRQQFPLLLVASALIDDQAADIDAVPAMPPVPLPLLQTATFSSEMEREVNSDTDTDEAVDVIVIPSISFESPLPLT